MKKEKTKPTKKKILLYYLVLAACLLVITAVTVGVVFAVRNNRINDSTAQKPTEQPDKPSETDKPDEPQPETPPVQDTSSKYEFIAPVEEINLTQAHVFGYNKTVDCYRVHGGMDFSAKAGSKVLAAIDGTVKSITTDELYGNVITIEHADGVTTVYKFVEPVETLKAGSTVNRGDVIATVAQATGFEKEDGDHLHFEVYKQSVMTDPDLYLKIISK